MAEVDTSLRRSGHEEGGTIRQWRSLWHSQPPRREVLEHMASKVKGMVQLAGVTYRIVRVAQGAYSVVRISDDMERRSFSFRRPRSPSSRRASSQRCSVRSRVSPFIPRRRATLASLGLTWQGWRSPARTPRDARRAASLRPFHPRAESSAGGGAGEFRRSFDRRCRAHDAVARCKGDLPSLEVRQWCRAGSRCG